MKDKLVLFDWGGVLINQRPGDPNNTDNSLLRLAKRLGNDITLDEAIKLFDDAYQGTSHGDFATKKEPEDVLTWFDGLKKRLKIDLPVQEFINLYIEEFLNSEIYQDVIDYMYTLNDRCAVGILSNLLPIEGKVIATMVDLEKLDYVFLSYMMGTKKPKESIYKIVELESGYEPSNILFIDNLEKNTDPAKKLGWNVCTAFGDELDKIKSSVDNFLNN